MVAVLEVGEVICVGDFSARLIWVTCWRISARDFSWVILYGCFHGLTVERKCFLLEANKVFVLAIQITSILPALPLDPKQSSQSEKSSEPCSKGSTIPRNQSVILRSPNQ